MIAIVDGGATKCDWVLLHENSKEELLKTQTIGLNPNIIAHDKIANEIAKNPPHWQKTKHNTKLKKPHTNTKKPIHKKKQTRP